MITTIHRGRLYVGTVEGAIDLGEGEIVLTAAEPDPVVEGLASLARAMDVLSVAGTAGDSFRRLAWAIRTYNRRLSQFRRIHTMMRRMARRKARRPKTTPATRV